MICHYTYTYIKSICPPSTCFHPELIRLINLRIKQKQLESIFTLMKQQEDKFGVSSISEVQEQLKLYAL